MTTLYEERLARLRELMKDFRTGAKDAQDYEEELEEM